MSFCSSHKEGEGEGEGEEVDKDNENGRINGLSDDILCDIVSRLDTFEASRTSILSRRWRNIWTSNPELTFYSFDTDDRERFLRAISQSLELYSSTGHKLEIFFIRCCFFKNHVFHLEQWIQTLSRLDVEELDLGDCCLNTLGGDMNNAFTFSFKLINGLSRLRKLDLWVCNVETSFVGQCNSLVSISLGGVPLLRHELSDILLACPNLTSLVINQCELSPNLKISGPNLKLETLEFRSCECVQKLDISDCNLVTIIISILTEVEVSLSVVPKLESLQLWTPRMHYCFGDMPQLKFLFQAANQILALPPTFKVFGNVRILYMLTIGFRDDALKEVYIWNFAPVLSACPLLEEFYLSVGNPICEGEREMQLPAMRHKHLEHMELSGFSNTQDELEFAKFILASAEVLSLLLLRSSIRIYDPDADVFRDKNYLTPIDTQEVSANLQGHALSTRARVEIIMSHTQLNKDNDQSIKDEDSNNNQAIGDEADNDQAIDDEDSDKDQAIEDEDSDNDQAIEDEADNDQAIEDEDSDNDQAIEDEADNDQAIEDEDSDNDQDIEDEADNDQAIEDEQS